MNIAQLLVRGARLAGTRPAWRFGDRTASYPDLLDRVGRLAGGLAESGLGPGDRVVLALPNRPELVETLWACFWGGYVAVPINWHLHADEVAFIAEQCATSAVLLSDETADLADALPERVRVLTVGRKPPTGAATPYEQAFAGVALPMVDVAPDDPAWLFYTSGTTGRPKGATLSHRNLMAMTLNYYGDVDTVAPASTFLHAAPLTHGSGLYLLPATGRGATNVVVDSLGFDPDRYLALVESEQVTHGAFLAPTMLNRVVRAAAGGSRSIASLRSVIVGGAPLHQDDLRRAREVLGPVVGQIYGQGEAPMTISSLRPEDTDDHLGSCGRGFTGVEVRIVGPEGNVLPAGQDGEVVLRGDVVMAGYWQDPAATARAVVSGWLRTGDIGHLDSDGFLFLTDRAKDVIITGGSNVYPREVEDVLLSHAAVAEVAVFGVPDREWGESICAVVVVVPGAETDARDLIAHCRQRLASFKKPRHVVFVDELPKNATGKVVKRDLRATVEAIGSPTHP